MSHAQVTAMFSEEDHPRSTEGSTAGQFAKKDGSSSSSKPAARKAVPAKTTPKRKGRTRREIPHGQLGFDGVSGTGYGVKGGDKRVRSLQEELNRLGLTDARGRKLRVDGELGPLTTQAIRAAQRRLGMRPTGIIAPAFIDRLRATKTLPKPAAPVRKAAPHHSSRVRAKFNPDQLRDPDGTWGDGIPGPGGAVSDVLKLAGRIELGDGETLHSSGKFTPRDGEGSVAWAVVDGPGGRQVRLGALPTEDVGKWRAANKGATASLSPNDVAQLRDGLTQAQTKGKADVKKANAVYDSGDVPTDPVHLGEAPVSEGRIASPWGDVEFSTYTDGDDPISYQTTIRIGDASPEDVSLDAKDLAKLIKELDGLASAKVAAAELRGIELARPGRWKLASGPMTVTKQHLIDAARYAQRATARPGYVKIGHNDPRFAPGDGEPALGWVHNVRYAEDERGPKLVGDIHDMPDWLAAAAPTAWPDRSIEGWADFTDEDGEKYALVVDGVALLGVTPPGMSSIQSLRDLPKAVGVAAASGTRVVASMASAPVAVEEGAGPMDPAKIREALGLSADAPDDEVGSALTVAAATLTGGDPAPAPVQASLFGDEPKAKAPAKTADVAQGSWMRVEASAWAAAQERIQKLEAQAQRQREGERDQVIAEAVRAGKFAPARREHWVRLWNADPEGTREVIDGLARNVMPVAASGYAGGVDDVDLDREFADLFPPVVK